MRGFCAAPTPLYQEAIRRAEDTVGAPRGLGPTVRAEGSGVAMTVKGPGGDVVVAVAGLAAGLFAEKGWRLPWNILHHELGHVHDNAKERDAVQFTGGASAKPSSCYTPPP